jgi:hypothetical protein
MNQTEMIKTIEEAYIKLEAQDALIDILTNQVVDLTMMSKIELGDDVIKEINRLKAIINESDK